MKKENYVHKTQNTVSTVKMAGNTATPPSKGSLIQYNTPLSRHFARFWHRNSKIMAAGAALLASLLFVWACGSDTPPAAGGNARQTIGGVCATDNDCTSDLRCTGPLGTQVCSQPSDGTVGSLCGTDNHCNDPLVCDAGLCSDGTGSVGDTCTDNDSCTDALICDSDNVCRIASGNSCSADAQCAGALICTGATGSQVCSQAGTGAGGSVCGNNGHCTSPLVCGNGLCGIPAGGTCAADSECAGTLICTGRTGSLVCSQPGTGATGSVCGTDDHCTSPLICGNGACGAAVGAACSANNDCAGDLTCGASVCSAGSAGDVCGADNQCAAPLVCNGIIGSQMCGDAGTGAAGSVCGNDNHCTGTGLLCVSGACSMDADRDGTLDSADIDDDNDGLIEISTLTELHNIRYNLEGTTYDDEDADTGTGDAGITTGAPTEATSNCTTATNGVYLCGYELTQNLDFDLDQDGSTHTTGTLDPQDNAAPHFVVADGGWDPIGSGTGADTAARTANTFRAVFEGNGYTIANMTISRAQQNIGLFGRVADAGTQIRNIGLTDVYVSNTFSSSDPDTGGLAGQHASSATIIASYVTGTVISGGAGGNHETGGLVGRARDSSEIIASHAAADVTAGSGANGSAGGLVGRLDGAASITASYATGNANGGTGDGDFVGGLVGWQAGGHITASYATGDANAGTDTNDSAGRLTGFHFRGNVAASYGFGTPTGTLSGVSTRPVGITAVSGLTVANTAQCSDLTYTIQTACESSSLVITGGTWSSMECSAPTANATDGVDYTTYTTMETCTNPPAKTTAHNWITWNSVASNTLNAWIFAAGTAPKLRYADYDGVLSRYSCNLFPATVTCGANGDQIPGQ